MASQLIAPQRTHALSLGRVIPFVILLLTFNRSHVVANDARERFIADYSPHASGLKQYYVGWEYKIRQTSRGQADTVQEEIYTIRSGHDFYKYSSVERRTVNTKTGQVLTSTLGQEVSGLNGKYAFEAHRKDQGLVLRKMSKISGKPDPNAISFTPVSFPYANAFYRRTYLELAQEPTTDVISYETMPDGRRELAIRPSGIVAVSRFTFDPSSGWVCTRLRDQTPGNKNYSEEIYHYKTSEGPIPPIKGWEFWRRSGDPATPDVRIMSNEVLEAKPNADVTEEECRLSAFGLPEPTGVVWEKPSRRYIWFIVGAAAFLVAAIGFRLLARRRACRAA